MTVKDLIDTVVYQENTVFEIAAKAGEFNSEYDSVFADSPLMEYIKEYEVRCWQATGGNKIRIRIW